MLSENNAYVIAIKHMFDCLSVQSVKQTRKHYDNGIVVNAIVNMQNRLQRGLPLDHRYIIYTVQRAR